MRNVILAGVSLPVLLLASIPFVSSAQAADLPRRTLAPAPAVAYAPAYRAFTWTGGYAGVTAGYGWGSYGDLGSVSFGKPSGFSLGGTLGYNYQMGQVVVGVEGDLSWANYRSSQAVGAAAPYTYYSARTNWLGTARVRVGYAADRALVYVTGGYAVAPVRSSFSNAGVAGPPLVPAASGSVSDLHHGFALGAGIEYALTNSVSVKAEYLYASLGKKSMFPAPYRTEASFSTSLIRAGVNYHF
ncbi:MAG: hypothetical protein JWN93_1253 [Hyphomicrobiales bacterium]|nr:hypothetical protein [Hyphomicrobiales bacterium]